MIEALRRIEAKTPVERTVTQSVDREIPCESPASIASTVEATFDQLQSAVALAYADDAPAEEVVCEMPEPASLSQMFCTTNPKDREPLHKGKRPTGADEGDSSGSLNWSAAPSRCEEPPVAQPCWEASEPCTEATPSDQSIATDEPCGNLYQEMAKRILEQLTPGRPAALLFTSPHSGNGKTSLIANLAPALVQYMSDEVLLVDANTGNPHRLATKLGVEPLGGLPDGQPNQAAWTDLVRPTAIARLSLLPGGAMESADASGTSPMDPGRLIRELVRNYTLVLVNAGSLAREGVMPLVSCCEGTYLVVRLGQSSRRIVRSAAKLIEQFHGRLLGCIVVE